VVATLPTVAIGSSGKAVVHAFLPYSVTGTSASSLSMIVKVDGSTVDTIPETLPFDSLGLLTSDGSVAWEGLISGLSVGNHSFEIDVQNTTAGTLASGSVPTSPSARLVVQPE
jgi:hypothetical protein